MKLNLMAATTPTGYGITGLNMTKALHEVGCDVKLYDIGNISHYNTQEECDLVEGLKANTIPFDYDAPCVRIWHQHALDIYAGRGRKIGYPIFELNTFRDIEKHHLLFPDELFVCSKWGRQVIKDQIGRDSKVVPLGTDTSVFFPTEDDNHPDYVFLNVGKWEVRKGHDVLVDIFNRAFRPDDHVALHILASEAWSTEKEREEWRGYYSSSPLGNKVKFIPQVKRHIDVAKIMRRTDCGIFPSRAEGWNLELLEMMACGKPVITTNYSAHTEFCTPQNSFLVDITETEIAVDGKFFNGEGEWAHIGEAQINRFAELMREVFEKDVHLNPEGVKTAREYTWENSAKTLISHLTP